MAKIRHYVNITLVALLMNACSSVSVTTDYDHNTSFSQYHTYSLAPSKEEVALSPSSEAALEDALRVNLGNRGLTETSENSDLHIVSHVFTKEKINVYQSSDWGYRGIPYGYGRYGMWAGAPRVYTDVSQYTEGTLILDFVDTKTNKLVFRGIGTGTVGDPQTNAENIREAVKKIVLELPEATQ